MTTLASNGWGDELAFQFAATFGLGFLLGLAACVCSAVHRAAVAAIPLGVLAWVLAGVGVSLMMENNGYRLAGWVEHATSSAGHFAALISPLVLGAAAIVIGTVRWRRGKSRPAT